MKPLTFFLFLCVLLMRGQTACCQEDLRDPFIAALRRENKINFLLRESEQELWLVKAQCVSITPDTRKTAQWRIDHVYNGPDTLKGKNFSFGHGPVITSQFATVIQVPDQGDDSLWIVRLVGDQVIPDPGTMYVFNQRRLAYGLALPVIQNRPLPKDVAPPIYSDFSQALTYAQSIERIAKADRNEQIRLLGAYAKSEMPQRSAWAISTLAQSGIESAPKFLLGLLNEPKLPLAGVLALDKGLQALDANGKAQWSRTSTRFDLWRGLVTAPANENDGLAIVSGVLRIAQEESQKQRSAQMNKATYAPDVGGARLFEWLRLAADNAKWAPKARSYAMEGVGELAQTGRTNLIGRNAAFAYLLRELKSAPELGPNGKAATLTDPELYKVQGPLFGLRYLRPFSAAEAAPLRALQKRARSPFAKELFGQLFEKNP